MKPPETYYAHTPNEKGEWHLLEDHLRGVAKLARQFGDKFGAGDWAELAGWWHDLGKVNSAFQNYLTAESRGQKSLSVPHSIWGAALAYAFVCKAKRDAEGWKALALPIQGHHGGLDDVGVASTKLEEFLSKEPDALREMQETLTKMPLTPTTLQVPGQSLTQRELFIRMLFSTLVDADRLDTEAHQEPEKNRLREGYPGVKALWEKLRDSQNEILDDSTLVNRVRREVYEACLHAARGATGLYRLTVPTGGGKTRSGLAFALSHALSQTPNLERVVVAIPYTSIIDQTADEYRKVLKNLGEAAVLEHHSALEELGETYEEQDENTIRRRLATENWVAPLIVTTTVQLFESLFSNKASRCRKLHHLARSVIVLDEIQTLPPELLKPTLNVLAEIAKPVEQGGYGSTVVFCTATQPAYEESRWVAELDGTSITEIVPNFREHFSRLKRVTYHRRSEAVPWKLLAEEISALQQVLVVLNSRKDALALLDELAGQENVFHLSTLLCGSHRRDVLKEVRRRLGAKKPEPVRLISTQVVEAGVDLDFPIVYRAIGPLDRIVQAAGRCNREMRLGFKGGQVHIFEPAEGRTPGGAYKEGLETARFLVQEYSPQDLHDPDRHKEYFLRLFEKLRAKLDSKVIQDDREALNYRAVAEKYRLINQDTVSVVVPFRDARNRLSEWQARPNRHTWQKLQPFLVSLFRYEVDQKRDWLDEVSDGLYLWTGGYDANTHRGIVEGFNDPSDLVVCWR